MAHELEIAEETGTARFFAVRKEAWHHLGKVIPSGILTVQAALEAAQLDWQVLVADMAFQLPMAGLPGQWMPTPSRKALIRSSDFKPLGFVSDQYVPLQNREAFDWFDPLVASGRAEYESAGALCEGSKIWIQAKLNSGAVAIGGDEHKPFLLLSNGHDGKTGALVMPCFQRVVCDNTLRMALGEGGIISFNHTGDMVAKIERAKAVLGLAQERLDAFALQLNTLAGKTMDVKAFDDFLDVLLDIPAPVPVAGELHDGEVTDMVPTHKQKVKAGILELHENGLEVTPNTGTWLGAYNTLAAYVDHFAGGRSKDRANYVLFGDGGKLKDRALELALQQN